MRYERDGYTVEAALAKGRQFPEWYLEAPEELPGDEFYLTAFRDLSTGRGPTGQIPWRDVVEYARLQGLTDDVVRAFVEIIRTMDRTYLRWMEEQRQNAIPQQGSPTPRATSRRH